MQIAIDTGGTFTDCLGRRADGTLLHLKLPSTPRDPAAALLEGVARLVAMAGGEAPSRIVHGSTVATNALLEGTGGVAVLIADQGYEDVLILARQQRPDLYALEPRPVPPPLKRAMVLGYPGRTLADGSLLTAPTGDDTTALIENLTLIPGLQAIGICFLHAYAHPQRELDLCDALRAAGVTLPISCSHELSTLAGEYERAVTTALNARLIPVAGAYLERIAAAIGDRYPDATLEIVCSNGDTLPPHIAAQQPVRLLLSGPAGGVKFGAQLATLLGRPVLTLDIGGTSTDCACIPGAPLERAGGEVAGLPVRAPMLDLETVGAGGGSILWLDAGGALQVGPHSAGADPGPACYGRGDLPTLTDAHCLLGHLPVDVPLGGSVVLQPKRARVAIETLASRAGMTAEDLARGAIAIADQRIAKAVRQVSAARGHDPATFVLAALGGAGGLHAVAVARLLGIDTVVFPPLAGLASAQGLGSCALVHRIKRAVGLPWPLGPEFVERYLALVVEAREGWYAQHGPGEEPAMVTTAWARYVGQDTSLALTIESGEPLDARFHALHRRIYGFAQEDAPVELTHLEVALSTPTASWSLGSAEGRASHIEGPAVISEDNATLLIPEGASARLDASGCLIVKAGTADILSAPVSVRADRMTASVSTRADRMSAVPAPITLTLANDLLSSVAEEMALALEQSARSSNIKDRRDLSTALFDAGGRTLAQGAHIPVHLGSMGTAVAGVLAALALGPGQTAIVNSPYHGGTHLPDITLVTAVDLGSAGRAYVASRAHHADIGGSAPGSMPLSDKLEDEGILIPPTLFAGGEICCSVVLQDIREASRQPEERVGDLIAQLGANLRGARRLQSIVAAHPAGWFEATAEALIDYAATMAQTALQSMTLGTSAGSSHLESDGLTDGDIPIQVVATVAAHDGRRTLHLDFRGTSDAVPGPVNCPRAVTTAAVAYALRCLVPTGTPTNAGLLRDVRIAIPDGCLLDAPYPRPTSAGNVETSQKVVQAVFGALAGLVPGGLPSPSQGTMNNVLLGGTDPRSGLPFTYYETLAGGCGAGPAGPGATALHSHMTNSRNTPIEMVEARFPLIVAEYAVRRPSGGQPATPDGFPSGDGVRRAYHLLADTTVTLIADWPAESDPRAPKRGAAYMVTPDDEVIGLPSKWSGDLPAGTLLLIATPGGWGWDPPT